MERPISENEIIEAIWTLHPGKSPGPDGFTISFYRATWDIIKEDIKKMINWTKKKDKIGGATNSTFLALIPKEKNPLSIERFCPISLCNTSYKILTKILSTRKKKIMEKIISKTQGGFIAGRRIMDNIIIILEAIHSSLECK